MGEWGERGRQRKRLCAGSFLDRGGNRVVYHGQHKKRAFARRGVVFSWASAVISVRRGGWIDTIPMGAGRRQIGSQTAPGDYFNLAQ